MPLISEVPLPADWRAVSVAPVAADWPLSTDREAALDRGEKPSSSEPAAMPKIIFFIADLLLTFMHHKLLRHKIAHHNNAVANISPDGQYNLVLDNILKNIARPREPTVNIA
jgi:hypothetical protein